MAAEQVFKVDEAGSNLLRRLDPRVRLVAAGCFALVVVSLHGYVPLLSAVLLALAVLLLAKLPLLATMKKVITMDGFIFFMLLLLPFTVPGDTLFTVWGFTASLQGFEQAIHIGLIANAVMMMTIALISTMEPVTLGHALSRLGIPVKLVQLLLFTARYVEVIHQEYQRLRLAMKARSFRLSNSIHTYRSLGFLVGMMLVRALERSERILAAMKCRGFCGRLIIIDNLRFTVRDWYFMAISFLLLAVLLWLEYGHDPLF